MEAHTLARQPSGFIAPRSRKLLGALSDERLVEHLRRGNEAAFEVLYDRYQAGVLSYCRHMLGSLDQAEDALQQAFISAHADITTSDKPIRFKPWIYTIARNRCLTDIRARREQPSDDVDAVSTVGLSEEVQQRADLRDLVRDVQELPDEQRAALVLSELGDLSHADVAEVIGCEASKVKSLVFQARSGLIERRQARETSCEEIREQLSTLRGGSLRRGPLRRHVKACPGCTEFRDDVKRQRAMLAIVLPVIPSIGLRESALAAVGGAATGVGGGGAAAGGLGAAAFAKVGAVGAAKVAAAALAVGGVAVGGSVAVERASEAKGAPAPLTQSESSSSGAAIAAPGSAAAGIEEKLNGSKAGPGADGKSRGDENKNGFSPEQGGSNGADARDFAAGRGKSGDRGKSESAPGQTREPGSNGKAHANGKSNNGKANGQAQPQGKSNPNAGGTNGNRGGQTSPAKPEKPIKPTPPARTQPEPRANTQQPAAQPEPAPAPEPEPIVPVPPLGGSKGKSEGKGKG